MKRAATVHINKVKKAKHSETKASTIQLKKQLIEGVDGSDWHIFLDATADLVTAFAVVATVGAASTLVDFVATTTIATSFVVVVVVIDAVAATLAAEAGDVDVVVDSDDVVDAITSHLASGDVDYIPSSFFLICVLRQLSDSADTAKTCFLVLKMP